MDFLRGEWKGIDRLTVRLDEIPTPSMIMLDSTAVIGPGKLDRPYTRSNHLEELRKRQMTDSIATEGLAEPDGASERPPFGRPESFHGAR